MRLGGLHVPELKINQLEIDQHGLLVAKIGVA
jgi:hypothetical protein